MKRSQYNFNKEEILKMVDDGMMIKDIVEYYGCTREQLGWFTKKCGLNFKNNKNFRKNQSRLMSGSMNPTKGRKRTSDEMRGITKTNIERANAYWDSRYKDGITFNQYSKMCRYIIPKDMMDQAKWQEIEVDHIFSIKDCWENCIHPRYASCRENLRLVTSAENRQKAFHSNVTLEQFLSMIGVQRLSKAQFNWKRVE